MNRPIILAQATNPQGTPGTPTKIVPVNKPLGEQAIVIHLDGSTKLDLSSIANENITLIHLGDRLIILFDNHAQVTLENFYGPDGQPAADLTVELGPNRDVTAADFAGLFPVSTDPTVLPAAGDPGAPSSGGNFLGYVVPPFDLPSPLPLLGPTPFGNFIVDFLGGPINTTAEPNTIGLTGASLNGDTFEGGLVPQSSILTTGNDPGEPTVVVGGPGALNGLVNFGPAGPGAVPFGFVSQAAAEAWLASLNLTSQGMSVDHVTIVGNTMTVGTDPAQTGQPTNDPNPHDVFSLTVNPDGSVIFVLLGPLDDASPSHLAPGPAVLDQITLDLSGFIQATDAQGNTQTLVNDVHVVVHDDIPELIATIPSDSPDGPIANVVGGDVEETALASGTPGDLFGSGNGGGTDTITGNLNQLVAFGADGPDFDLVTQTYDGFQLVAQADAAAWITGLGLTSHDQAVDFAQIVGDTLTAWTGGGPGDPNAHEVFTLTIAGDGTFTFTLINPLDHPDPGHLHPAPEVADSVNIDLSGLVHAIDFDGDTITLSADFSVTVIDDVPVQPINDSESGGAIIVTVDEGGLTSGDPGDLFGSGNDPGFTTSATGTVSGLVSFGADGPDIVNGEVAAYQIAVGTDSSLDFGVTSHGVEVDFVTVTDGPAGPHGTSQTLTAWTEGGPSGGGHEVFTLTVNGDGTFTFQLINPIDHPIAGSEDTLTLDLSQLVAGVDFDGDTVALAAGTLEVNVIDDIPVVVSGTQPGTVDEGGLASGTPGDLYGSGNDPGTDISTTVSLSGAVSFGADGPANPAFQFVGSAAADGWLNSLNLMSHGQVVDVTQIVGNVLTAWTGGGPSDPNAHAVFSITLNGNETYTFNLINPIDHPDPGHATPGTAVEDSVSIDVSGFIEAIDFDNDPVALTASSTITIVDDIPVAQGNLVENGNFASGTFIPAFWGGFALPGDVPGWTIEPSDVGGAQPGFVQLERVFNGYLGVFMPNGDQMVDLEETPGNIKISQAIGGIVDGASYSLEFFAGASNPSSSELKVFWGGQLIEDIHPNGTETPYLVTVTGGSGDGSNILTFEEVGPSGDNTGTYIADVALEAGTPFGIVDEGGLASGTPGDLFGNGNDPGAPVVASGTLAGLVSFGADGPLLTGSVNTGFQFTLPTGAHDFGVQSHGAEVDFVTVTGPVGDQTLTAYTGGSSSGTEVFTLELHGDGTYVFTLINPLDHAPGLDENSVILNLTSIVQATDFDGDTIPLASGSFLIDVIDDVPVAASGTTSATVDEGGLTSGTPGDLYGSGNDPGFATSATVSLSGAVSFGADGPGATPFQFVSGAAANTWLNGLHLTSHGDAVDFSQVIGNVLTAWTGSGPSDVNAHEVFSITLNGSDYTFNLINPLDHPDPGHATPGTAVEDSLSLDLSGFIQAVDFDGDPITLSGGASITIVDDIPILQSNTPFSATVDEGALLSGTPGDLFGSGNDVGLGPVAVATGSLAADVSFGADGPDVINGNQAGFQFTIANNSTFDFGVKSHGVEVDFVTVTDPVNNPGHGLSQTLTAWTDGGPGGGGHEVFTLTLNGDGTWTFTLINPIDHPTDNSENVFQLDLSSFVHAFDFDGDAAPTISGGIQITIVDDIPVAQGNLVENGNFASGTFIPAFWGGFALPGDVPGWTIESSDVGGAQPGFVQLERVFNGYLGVFMPNGDQMVDLEETPGNIKISQAIGGIVDGATYSLEFFAGASNPGSSELKVFWGGQLIDDLHPNGTETPYIFQVIGGTGDGTNVLTFEEVGPSGDNTGTYIADVALEAGTPFGIVDEGGLASGTPGDLFGNGNDPGAPVVASGTLAGLVSFGADGPLLTGSVNTGFQFTLPTGAHDFGVQSHGAEVDFVTVTGPVGDQTLTAYTGGSISGTEVFTLELHGDGTYVFTLINPLDHAPGLDENSVILNLTSIVQATDFDGDTIPLASGSFLIDVIDDVPVAASNIEANATVDEGGLALSLTADLFGSGNDPGADTSATVSLSGAVSFGADGPGATPFQFVSGAAANTWLNGLHLTSHGDAVDFAQVIGNVLTAWTGGGPSDVNAHEVFSITLSGSDYTFNLINPIDHPIPGHGTPGSEVEDSITLDLSGFIQAADFDGDPITLAGGASITIMDDIPVAQGNLVENGNFASGTFSTAFWGGFALPGDVPGWTIEPSDVGGAQPGFVQLERVFNGYLDVFMSNGDQMVDLEETPGNIKISQAIGGIVNGASYSLEFFAGASNPGSSELKVFWGGQLIDDLHPNGTETPYIFQVIGGTGDGTNVLTFEEVGPSGDNTGTYIADVALEAGTPFGIVDEGGLTSGTPGDLFGNGNDPGAPVVASGTLAGLVSFGADGPQLDSALFNTGFQFTVQTGAHDFGVKSHGQEVNFITVSAPIDGPHGVSETLTAYTGGSSSGTEVFTLTVNGDGTWAFTLINPIDNAAPAPGAGEDSTIFDFSALVQAVDFDGDTTPLVSGSFLIDVIDDVPAAHSVSATMTENVSATVTLTDHVDFSYGADGPGTVTFDTTHAHFTSDPTGGQLVLPTAGQYTINGNTITLNPGADFQALNDGQHAVLDIPYTVTDHDGDTTTGDILVTINGAANSNLFFSADDPELFRLDQQGNLTPNPVNPSNPNGSSAGEDGGYIQFANQLYFFAFKDGVGDVLFKLGPDNVATPVLDGGGHTITDPGIGNVHFTVYNGSLFFGGQVTGHGDTLVQIDPTGAVHVFDTIAVNPDFNGNFTPGEQSGFAVFGGSLYFGALDANGETTGSLFKLDASHTLTELQYAGSPIHDAGIDGGLVTFNGNLYFNAADPNNFGQDVLFKLDTTGVATPVSGPGGELVDLSFGTALNDLHVFDGALYAVEDGTTTAASLFRIDTGGNATELSFGADHFDFTLANQRALGGLADFNDSLYFSANTATTDPAVFGNPALFQVDDAGHATAVQFNGAPITDAGEDGGFFSYNGHLYFFADDVTNATFAALYQIDAAHNVTELTDPTDGGSFGAPTSTNAHFTIFEGNLYFEAETGKGDELVEINSSGNAHVIDVNPAVGPPTGDSFPGENGGFGVYSPTSPVVGSGGDDTFQFTTGNFHGASQVADGGAGNDTMWITDTTAITLDDLDFANVTNVETLKIGGAGADTVTLGADASADVGGLGHTFTLDDLAGTGSLTLDASLMTANLKVLLDGTGNDVLTGGAGDDTFQFNAPPAHGNNQINGFNDTTQNDQLAVSAAGFGGGLSAGMNVASVFETSGDNTFNSSSDRFHFDTANNGLYYSADGTTIHEVLLATVTNHTVTGNDVHVVA